MSIRDDAKWIFNPYSVEDVIRINTLKKSGSIVKVTFLPSPK